MNLSYIILSFFISTAVFAVLYLTSSEVSNFKARTAIAFIVLTICMILGRGFFNSSTIFSVYLGACISILIFVRIVSKREDSEAIEAAQKAESEKYKVKYKG